MVFAFAEVSNWGPFDSGWNGFQSAEKFVFPNLASDKLLTTLNIHSLQSSSLTKVVGMFHPIVDHQPETLSMYSLHFGNRKGSLRTVLKHFLYLLKKTETVFICKL